MKKELNFKHISPYLPYNLKCKYPYGKKEGLVRDIHNLSIDEQDIKMSINFMEGQHIWMFKPLLRPMSDLFNKVQYKGESITPMERIIRIATGWYDEGVLSISDYKLKSFDDGEAKVGDYTDSLDQTFAISIKKGDITHIWRDSPYGIMGVILRNQQHIAAFLDELHFDWRFNLIEKGLAEPIKS